MTDRAVMLLCVFFVLIWKAHTHIFFVSTDNESRNANSQQGSFTESTNKPGTHKHSRLRIFFFSKYLLKYIFLDRNYFDDIFLDLLLHHHFYCLGFFLRLRNGKLFLRPWANGQDKHFVPYLLPNYFEDGWISKDTDLSRNVYITYIYPGLQIFKIYSTLSWYPNTKKLKIPRHFK